MTAKADFFYGGDWDDYHQGHLPGVRGRRPDAEDVRLTVAEFSRVGDLHLPLQPRGHTTTLEKPADEEVVDSFERRCGHRSRQAS